MIGREHERGRGRLGTIVGFAVLIAIGLGIWHVSPVYWENYNFQDKMIEICRQPIYNNPDDVIMKKLMNEVREDHLDEFIKPENCKINTSDHNRRIKCEYERREEILPGYERTFQFALEAEQPLL